MTFQTPEKTLKNEGLLLVNKPPDKTSFYLIKVLRALTKIKKIGHAGTLDPFATGVMVLLIGRSYTKLSEKLLMQQKEYEATLMLGFHTNTFDKEGEKTFISSKVPSLEEIKTVISFYQGEIDQTPPMFSAKKVQGQKLYDLARKGITIERKSVKVHLRTKIVSYNYPFLTLHINCSKGTYIRSLAHDIGKDLQTGAFLNSLTRLKSGPFTLEECLDFSSLQDKNFDYKSYLKHYPF